jgi:hypothetical protein
VKTWAAFPFKSASCTLAPLVFELEATASVIDVFDEGLRAIEPLNCANDASASVNLCVLEFDFVVTRIFTFSLGVPLARASASFLLAAFRNE